MCIPSTACWTVACRIDRMFDRLKAMGQTACHHGSRRHVRLCGVLTPPRPQASKPIIGCEVYVATRTRFDKVNRIDGNNHLIFAVQNETGYKNLIKMVSAGFYRGALLKAPHRQATAGKIPRRPDLPVCLSRGRDPQRLCWRGTTTAPGRRPCGTVTCLVRKTTISNCRTTALRRTRPCCRSSSV